MDYLYMWVHLVAALVFTFRVVAFFLWLADDTSSTRTQYYSWHSFSFIVLGLAGIGNVALEWVEWGHVPTWTIVLWVIVFGLNVYNIFVLKDFSETRAGVASAAEVVDNPADDVQMLVKQDLNGLRKRAMEILSNSME